MSMVAGLLVMDGGKLPRSVESSVLRLLPWQMVAFSWTRTLDSIRCWVAMVATQGRASASLQHPSGWAGAALIWCMLAIEGGLPTAPVNFEWFFYSKPCLVSFSGCCQFGRCGPIVLKKGYEYGAAEIPAHVGGDLFPVPHFSAQHPVIVYDDHGCGTQDDIQVLMVVGMSLDSRKNCLVHPFPDGTSVLNMISLCGYINFAWNQIYMEISKFGSRSIGHAT